MDMILLLMKHSFIGCTARISHHDIFSVVDSHNHLQGQMLLVGDAGCVSTDLQTGNLKMP